MTVRARVYVATEGSYSDYRILGVFTTREAAEAIGDVEEFDLWEKIPPKVTTYRLRAFPPDYEPLPIEVHILQPWDYNWDSLATTRRPKFDLYPNRGFQVSGSSRALVEKSFQDRRAQLLAEAEGIA